MVTLDPLTEYVTKVTFRDIWAQLHPDDFELDLDCRSSNTMGDSQVHYNTAYAICIFSYLLVGK